MYYLKRLKDVRGAKVDERGFVLNYPEIFNNLRAPELPLVKVGDKVMELDVQGFVTGEFDLEMDNESLVNVWN